MENIEYIIVDPSKNITALVLTYVSNDLQSEVAKKIFKKETNVEQVGFFSMKGDEVSLRMSGGEFCGNATMGVAAYYAMKKELDEADVNVKVYSIEKPIGVKIKRINTIEWEGIVHMPDIKCIKYVTFKNGMTHPVVYFSSIAHVIIEEEMPKEMAEELIKEWCDFIDIESLGIMFLDRKSDAIRALVYVRSVDSLFWENACASGTAAVGAYIANDKKTPIDIAFTQTGGAILTVFTDEEGNLYIKGKVKIGKNALEKI